MSQHHPRATDPADRQTASGPYVPALLAVDGSQRSAVQDGLDLLPVLTAYDPGHRPLGKLDGAGDAVALLDGLGIPRIHILSHSFSGLVALEMAINYPDRIDRMVLISTFTQGDQGHRAGDPKPPPDDWWDDDPVEWVRRAIAGSVGPEARNRLTDTEITALAELERGNRATWSSVLHRRAAGAAVDFSDVLLHVAAPTLVLHGDVDALVTTDLATALAEGIADARLVMLSGVGHIPWVEQPDEAISVILDFLGSTG